MKTWTKANFKDVTFGENVEIEAERASIQPGTVIGNNVRIVAKDVFIGIGSKIESGTRIRGLQSPMMSFRMEDQALIGFDNQIFCPSFSMGDYSQLHNNGLHSGYAALSIGHNCWIGQNTILNCTERLEIGNNVRIGTQSQLWTHVASGELLEGCTLYDQKPLKLEDDVWIVGGAVISPGLILREKSIIMTGAVLTKSTEPRHTYAGIPARDVTEKLPFWQDISLDEKFEKMKGFAHEFLDNYPEYVGMVLIEPTVDALAAVKGDAIALFKSLDWQNTVIPEKISSFDLLTKTYEKRRSPVEIAFVRFNVGFRARFIPRSSALGAK